MQNKKVIIKKHKAVKLPDINKPKKKSAWFKIFSGLACVIAIGVAIFITVTEISIHSDTGNVYHITTSNPSISKKGDINTSKIILWRGTNKDDTDHLKYTPDSNLVVINDGIISIPKDTTIDVATTVEIEGNIRGREVSTKIDLIPDAISNHDYHITISSPYLWYDHPGFETLTLRTTDNDNYVEGIEYERRDDRWFPSEFLQIDDNLVTMAGNSPEGAYTPTIYAMLNGNILGSITIMCFSASDTPESFEYVTTETIGSLQIDNDSIITMSIKPNNFTDMKDIQVVCNEDTPYPPSLADKKHVKITRTGNKWVVRLDKDTIAQGGDIIHLVAGNSEWAVNPQRISWIEVRIHPNNTKDTYAAKATPSYLYGGDNGNTTCELETTLNGDPFTNAEYELDPSLDYYYEFVIIDVDADGVWSISLGGDDYESSDVVDLTINVWLKSGTSSNDSLPLTTLLVTLIPLPSV